MAQSPENNPDPVLNDCQALLDENRALKNENSALQDEVQKLRARLEEPEELQRAISEGDLDALVMSVSEEDLMIFTLNSADQAYRVLMETANEDIVIVDAEFKVIYAGKRLLDKTGYSQEEVIGRPWLHFVDESSKVVAKDGFEQVLQGSSESYELKLVRKDGSPYWVIISAKPLFEDDKFKGILGMLTDITERKQAEKAMRESEQRERERAEELAALLDAVPTPVIIANDPDCNHLIGNRAANELMRLSRRGEISLTAPLERRPHHYKTVKEGRELRLDEMPIRRAAKGENVQDFEYTLVLTMAPRVN